jgi:hypothetical protein
MKTSKLKTWLSQAALIGLALGLGGNAKAQGLSTQAGGWDLSASGSVSVQGAAFSDLDTSQNDTDGQVDASLVLNAETVDGNGWVWGARAEFDTGDRQVEDLTRDEVYVYLSGEFGRFELGEQDGPADTISLHAPIVGLGQVRGDFARYTGEPALLSAFDTRDDVKVIYLSPPIEGFRWGASYAPKVESNAGDANPRRRTRQENAYEIAAAYQALVGDWALGVSAAYVGAEADRRTERGDLKSYSVGVELSQGGLTLGAGYVDRGDSNSLTRGLDETEWNLGAAWRDEGWGVAASAAVTQSSLRDNRLLGVGGHYEFNENWVVRADLVAMEIEPTAAAKRDAQVAIVEVAFRF